MTTVQIAVDVAGVVTSLTALGIAVATQRRMSRFEKTRLAMRRLAQLEAQGRDERGSARERS